MGVLCIGLITDTVTGTLLSTFKQNAKKHAGFVLLMVSSTIFSQKLTHQGLTHDKIIILKKPLGCDQHKLKTTEATEFRSQTLNFRKDMTKVKQDINCTLVLELKRNISNDPSTRWNLFY